jgi:hypothetical protein
MIVLDVTACVLLFTVQLALILYEERDFRRVDQFQCHNCGHTFNDLLRHCIRSCRVLVHLEKQFYIAVG